MLGYDSIYRGDIQPIDTSKFYVVTCISNPVRYRSRYHLYRKFAEHITQLGGKLYTVELATGDRPFEVTQADDPTDIQLRSRSEIWHKENMINIAISRLPSDWQYVAWIDADVTFQRSDIINETVQQLQHYDFVQMFSTALDLGPEPLNKIIGVNYGFGYCYQNRHDKTLEIPDMVIDGKLNPKRMTAAPKYNGYAIEHKKQIYFHPGFAWAARRSALDAVGGIFDLGILGAGDHHMALALVGRGMEAIPKGVSRDYMDQVAKWENEAECKIRRNIGFVPGVLTHAFHGTKANRRYWDRWRILVDNGFQPTKDLKRDSQGLWTLVECGDNRLIDLRDQIRAYFRQRNEDGTEL
jgi:hypothetical protein